MVALRTVVVEDHRHSDLQLSALLDRHAPRVSFLGKYPAQDQSLSEIDSLKPDLVFWDVGGRERQTIPLLKEWNHQASFQLVLTSDEEMETHPSLNQPILECITKPISSYRLFQVLDKASHLYHMHRIRQELTALKSEMSLQYRSKLAIPTMNGMECVKLNQVRFCESADSYSILHLPNKKTLLVSKCLSFLERSLTCRNFVRIHRKYLLNLQFLQTYQKGEGGQVVLEDGTILSVARNRKKELIQAIKLNFGL
ncbi:MAG: LytTR family transcriptional regulator DNA-binding domain-containing protein [Bacteroidota bacterium]